MSRNSLLEAGAKSEGEICRVRVQLQSLGVNTIISLAYIQRSRVSILEPWQNNLSNPKKYSEACQTFKKPFCKTLFFTSFPTYFVKHSILDV